MGYSHLVIHSFNKYPLCINYVPGPIMAVKGLENNEEREADWWSQGEHCLVWFQPTWVAILL
jgi:hypothetical protein